MKAGGFVGRSNLCSLAEISSLNMGNSKVNVETDNSFAEARRDRTDECGAGRRLRGAGPRRIVQPALESRPRPDHHPRANMVDVEHRGTLDRHERGDYDRSEEHTSELQSQSNLVCRLLLEKKKKKVADQPILIKQQTIDCSSVLSNT